MSSASPLHEMGPAALQHREQVEEVKRRVNIQTSAFDGWIYNFLENKHYDVEETVAKLHRRDTMERTELANYDVTDYMREQMSKGVIQLIGYDKEGRVTFYIVTARDKPRSDKREENKRNFDMWMSYGTRLRKENKRCRITMLINQDGASMWSNTDMTFQSNIALRVSKFYPGMVDKMYVCKMGRTLGALAKPIFASLPKAVSEKIYIITDSDIEKGRLLDLFEPDVLPAALGGRNAIDGSANHNAFCRVIEDHFVRMKRALVQGVSVKEWELSELRREEQAAQAAAEALVMGKSGTSRHEHQGSFDENNNSSTLAKGTPKRRRPSNIAQKQEQQQMLKPPSVSGVHRDPSPQPSSGRENASEIDRAEFQTCQSNLSEYENESDVFAAGASTIFSPLHDRYDDARRGRPIRLHADPWINLLLTLEQEQRHTIEEFEHEARFNFYSMRDHSGRAILGEDIMMGGVEGEQHLVTQVPRPARAMFRIALYFACFFNALYFAAGTIYLANIACAVAATFFMGMFVKGSFVYPLGCAFVLAAMQGCMIASRGFELGKASFYGKLLSPLRPLGVVGPIAQAVLFFSIILIQFVIFCVYAAQQGPLLGLRTSFATGYLSCALIIALVHVVYPLGLLPRAKAFGVEAESEAREGDVGDLSLYIFFEITEDESEEGSYEHPRTSSVLLAFIPGLISILFGIGFLQSRIVLFAVVSIVAALAAGMATTYMTEFAASKKAAHLIRFVVWMACLVWVYDMFAMGFIGWTDEWGSAVIVVSLIFGLFLVAAVACAVWNSRSLLRVTVIALGLLGVACIVLMFVVVNWSLGVFGVVVTLHTLGVLRRRGGSVLIAGVLLVLAGIVTLIVACVLLGWAGTPSMYALPHSLPSSGSAVDPYADTFALFQRNPVCAIFFQGNTTGGGIDSNATSGVSVVDFALLNELVTAIAPFPANNDFATWFPSWVDRGAVPMVTDTSPVASLHAYALPSSNVTVLVLQNTLDPFLAAKSVTMLVDAIALSPLALLLPRNWTSPMISVQSWASFMVPFEWRDTIDSLKATVRAYSAQSPSSVVLTANGLAGTFAAVVAVGTGVPAVTFGAAGTVDIAQKFSINADTVLQLVLNVAAYDGAYALIGDQQLNAQYVPCKGQGSTQNCQSPQFFSESVLSACMTSTKRHA